MATNQGNQGNQGGKSAKGGTSTRGFASMDPERQRQIASEGGKASHQSGNAHEFTSEEARQAGRTAHQRGKAHEFTSEEARLAGMKSRGGQGARQGDKKQNSQGGAQQSTEGQAPGAQSGSGTNDSSDQTARRSNQTDS